MSTLTTQPAPQPAAPRSPASGSPWKTAFTSRSFLVAVAVLAIAAMGFNSATEALQLYFKKQPVSLRQRLDEGVPEELGENWVAVSEQSALDPEVQHSLGTKEFVFRTYVDTAAVPPELMAVLKPTLKDPAQAAARHAVVAKIQEVAPQAVIALNVTYYTGMVDTVTHIPERCMVADGFEPRNPQTVTLVAGEQQIPAQFSTFEDQTGRGRMNRHVAYFFHCNGGYEPNPVAVRVKLQNLFERHGYYAKVELMSDEPARAATGPGADAEADARRAASATKAQAAMADLLGNALPKVEQCLPDWKQVKSAGAGTAK